jgi:hypothetical protein
MRTPAIQAELNTVPGLIKQYEPVLARHGFVYKGMYIETSKNLADNAVMTFANDKANRQIRLAYYPPFKDDPRGFVVAVVNTKTKKEFFLPHYLKAHDRSDLQDWLSTEERNPDLRVYWADFFSKLDQILDDELKDIVEGRDWEDIPFDFGGYK